MDRRTIARKATAEALRTRVRAGYGLDTPLCVYDLAGRLGVEVRFFDLPSMEGVYYNSPKPHIVLSSLRPAGRVHSHAVTNWAITPAETARVWTKWLSSGCGPGTTRRSSMPTVSQAPC